MAKDAFENTAEIQLKKFSSIYHCNPFSGIIDF